MTDTIIIGAGPAGISCALECVENRVETLVLERHSRIGGQLPAIPSPITNFSGGTYSNGSAFRNALEKTARKVLNGVVRTAVDVRKVDLAGKTIETDRGLPEGRTIVIATGYRVRELPLDLPMSTSQRYFTRVVSTRKSLGKISRHSWRWRQRLTNSAGPCGLMPGNSLAGQRRQVPARPDVLEKVMQSDRISVIPEDCHCRNTGRWTPREYRIDGSDRQVRD
ncbi:MAG: NAD(P)-binding domain-containing protein [Candidatus Melainabacteria bacterium]|nr:NAD(P)-binding domain-containing protein [Candidatus Melainabacteria bacterium]